MKTEQEQIKAIKQIIDERVETTLGQVQGCRDNIIKTVDTVIIAIDIVNAGYGDVSEYKAEIERLKDDYAKLQEQFAQYQMASDKEIIAQKKEAEKRFESNMKAVLEIEKKQAKIDVLNELKKYLHTEDFDTPDECWKPESEFCAIIDKIIKEVQNGEDKG